MFTRPWISLCLVGAAAVLAGCGNEPEQRKPVTDSAAAPAAAVKRPARPIPEKPGTATPAVAEPVEAKPAVAEPVVAKPATDKPAETEPAAMEAVDPQPATAEVTAAGPSQDADAEEPAADSVVTDTPREDAAAAAKSPTEGAAADATDPTPAEGFGSITGKLVWKGALPTPTAVNVTTDKDYCLEEGPLKDREYFVDPETKGLEYVFAYLKKADKVYEGYPQDAAAVRKQFEEQFHKDNGFPLDQLKAKVQAGEIKPRDIKAPVVIDQVQCLYMPPAAAIREGQPTIVLNPEPIAHNVKVSGFAPTNNLNQNMPPETVEVMDLKKDAIPVKVECSIHGWMSMQAMVFDHPYFAVTGKDGSFIIKNVPPGDVQLILRAQKYIDAETGGKGASKGNTVTVKAGEVTDLGTIEVTEP